MVIFQRPNVPSVVTAGAFLAAWLLQGRVAGAAFQLGNIFLGVWSWLELTSGASWFRRLLGLLGMVLAIGLAVAYAVRTG